MTRFCCCLVLSALLPAAPAPLRADGTNPGPSFHQVYDLLRAHLAGATDERLNRSAVRGLLAQFPGRVSLIAGPAESPTKAALEKSLMLEGNVAYLRVGRVGADLADDLLAARRALAATNKVAGFVLDLRFAGGDDVSAAQAAAKAIRSHFSPLAILVNGETRDAAATLAAALRARHAGLVLGSPPARAAGQFQEFTLSDGERLRIETGPKTDDAPAMAAGALQPDIAIRVSAATEHAFLENPYRPAPTDEQASGMIGTNLSLPAIDHTTEADLVREKRYADDEGDLPPRAAKPPKPVIRDPVLARGVDLIKGLAVLRQSRL
ncbi:MAG: hypothetical protein KGJ60_11635 [Verrucomicrobiota bacterium]|nr:hypothetical protein [Verrucomicrobiota bacterium]